MLRVRAVDHSHGSAQVTRIDQCWMLHPADNELEEVVAGLMRTLRILPPAAAGEEEEDTREGVQVEPMISAAAEGGDPSPDFFQRYMARRQLARASLELKASE